MSGSNRYTEDEISARIDALRTGVSVVNRNTRQSADDLVDGVKDLVFRTLNSDVDSVYALLKLFANRHISFLSKALANIDSLERYAPISRQEDPLPDTSKLDTLLDISYRLEVASEGEREVLLQEFSRVATDFTKSSVTADGFHNAGISPAYAQEQSIILAEETGFLIEVILAEAGQFLDALTNYSGASFEPLSFSAQARKATTTLLSHEGSTDLSGALLDATILASLLSQQSVPKLDITEPKYNGSVDTRAGVSAEMIGGTKPFILDEDSSVVFTLGSGASASVHAPQSVLPNISVSLGAPLFTKEDAGILYHQTTPQVSADEKWFSSSGTDTDGGVVDDLGNPVVLSPYLKSVVRPSTGNPNYDGGVQVNALVHDGGTDLPVTAVDDGVSGVLFSNDTASWVLAHILSPDSPYNGMDLSFTFTSPYPGRMKPPIYEENLTWTIVYLENTIFQYAFTPTLTPGTTAGFYECTGGAAGDYCEINFSTGEINLTFGVAPSALAAITVTGYQVAFGRVDYETGHIFIQMPHPLTEGSYLTCSHGFHPLARMEVIDTTPGVYPPPILNDYSVIKIFKHNTLLSAVLPTPTPGNQLEWVTSGADLVTLLGGTSFVSDVQVAYSGATNTLWFASDLHGSASRIAFPNHQQALPNSTPFAPVWSSQPNSINEAIGALYSSRGEFFGSDTPFADVTSSGPITVSCPPNTIATGVPITAILAALPSTTTISVDLPPESLEVGDDVRVTWGAGNTGLSRSARVFHTKITGISGPGASSVLDVWPTLPLAIDDASVEGLTLGGDWSCTISRSKIKVKSQNNEAESAISVTTILGDDLGFVDGATTIGSSSTVALRGSVKNGYEIHPNDVVIENGSGGSERVIGRVTSVLGDNVSFEVPEGTSHIYPYEDLKIVSLGWYRFTAIRDALFRALQGLESITGDNLLLSATNIFVSSGSGQGQYMSLLFALRSALNPIRESYLGYDAHIVKTVDKLLDTLKQERLTLPLNMLMTGQFSEVSELTVAEVSNQTSLDNLLVRAFNLLGGETSFIEYSTNNNPLTDYDTRGINTNTQDIDPAAPED